MFSYFATYLTSLKASEMAIKFEKGAKYLTKLHETIVR